MGERGMKLRMWFAGRWEQLIAVNALDEEEIRQGRLFNILMIISIVLVIFLVLLFLLMNFLHYPGAAGTHSIGDSTLHLD